MNDAENAIHQDALEQSQNDAANANPTPAGGENEAQEPPKSARELAMESIAARRTEQLASEGVDVEAATPPPAADPPPRPTADDQLAAQMAADERTASSETRVKVKVDGEEMELPLSEVVKSYQKDATATKRLQEATALLRQAQEQVQKPGSDTAQNANQDDQPGGEEALGKIKQVFSKLYEGDEDGAAAEMLALMQTGAKATPNIDPNAVAAQVMQQLEVKSVYGEVQASYPALFEQTERGAILGRETVNRMAAKEQTGVSRAQAFREAAQEVASMFGIEKAGRNAEPQRTARDEKLERKQQLDIPNAANVAAGGAASPAEAPNPSSVIQQMAAQRLGQSMRTSGRIN